MLVPWFYYNACSITRDSQGKRVQFGRQHAKVRDFTSRHACLEIKFGFRQVQVCFIGGSLQVILSSMLWPGFEPELLRPHFFFVGFVGNP